MKISPDDVRKKISEVGLNYVQVADGADVGISWLYKTLLEPSKNHKRKYHFNDPNPQWMARIMKFLNAYAKLKGQA